MNYELPLVIFTVLTQLAMGLALFAGWKELGSYLAKDWRNADDNIIAARSDWLYVGILTALGLIASLVHLPNPMRAFEVVGHLGASWLSWEAILFVLFAVLAFAAVFSRSTIQIGITLIVAILALIAQAFTYSAAGLPAFSSGATLILFAVSALALGSSFAQWTGKTQFISINQAMLILCFVVFLALPLFWQGGNTALQATASAWLSSPLFWTSLILLALAFLMNMIGFSAIIQSLVVLVAIFCGRLVFFGETVHTASLLGLP